jgi:hypothetical protein
MDRLFKLLKLRVLVLLVLAMSLGCEDKPDPDDDDPPSPPRGAQGTFLAVGSMGEARYDHRAAGLGNGDVLIAGGRDGSGNPLATAELYHYLTGVFTPTGGVAGGMARARAGHTLTVLGDGRVLIVGGEDGSSLVAVAEIYNPWTHTLTSVGALIYPRKDHVALRLSSGNVLVAGGEGSSGTVLSMGEIFDWRTESFAVVTGGMTAARTAAAAALLDDGRALVAGGVDGSGAVLSSAELFTSTGHDPSGSFAATETMPGPRARAAAVKISPGGQTGKVLLFGGVSTLGGSGELGDAVLYDKDKYVTSGGFQTVVAAMMAGRDGHRACVLAVGGKVLVSGGTLLNVPEIFDPCAGGTTAIHIDGAFDRTRDENGIPTSMTANLSRSLHTATFLPNGTVLLAGGMDGALPTASAEVFSP